MQVGRAKDIMAGTDAKIFGLDEPWIVLNCEVRSAFRIDLDITFANWDALKYEIEQLSLPCLPHIVVGFEDDDGRIERPHLLYLLPFNQGVWFSDDPRCRRDVMSLFRGVHAGLTKRFLHLGADPGALSNPMRTKNPLSPFWSFRAWNEDAFPTMSEWAEWVDTSATRERLIRESAAALAGTDRKSSNLLFTTFQAWCYETLRDLHRAADPAYTAAVLRKDQDALAEMLLNTIIGRASAGAENPRQAQAILYRVVDYAAAHWDPARCSRDDGRDRGAAADVVDGIKGTIARQAAGARYSNDLRRARSATMIQGAIKEAEAAGETITISGIARRTGLDRKTVRSHWPLSEGVGVGNTVYSKKEGRCHGLDTIRTSSAPGSTSPR